MYCLLDSSRNPRFIQAFLLCPTQFYLGFCQNNSPELKKNWKKTYWFVPSVLFQAKFSNLSLSLTFAPIFSKPPRHSDFSDCFLKLNSSICHFISHFFSKKLLCWHLPSATDDFGRKRSLKMASGGGRFSGTKSWNPSNPRQFKRLYLANLVSFQNQWTKR